MRMSTHRARKRIREAKRKARPELASSDMWVAKDYKNTFDLSYKVNDTLERIHNDEVSEEEFIRRFINSIEINQKLQQILFYRFEAPYKPVAIQGVVDTWSAK